MTIATKTARDLVAGDVIQLKGERRVVVEAKPYMRRGKVYHLVAITLGLPGVGGAMGFTLQEPGRLFLIG